MDTHDLERELRDRIRRRAAALDRSSPPPPRLASLIMTDDGKRAPARWRGFGLALAIMGATALLVAVALPSLIGTANNGAPSTKPTATAIEPLITPTPPRPTTSGAWSYTGFAGLSWSSDGSLLMASADVGIVLLDKDTGTVHAEMPGTWAGWIGADRIAVWTAVQGEPGHGSVAIRTTDGTQVETIAGDFGVPIFGQGVARLALPNNWQSASSATFRVWDGSSLSEARAGIPLAWSPDGSLLAVLLPSDKVSVGMGVSGRLAIERQDGTLVKEFGQPWVNSALAGLTFSPDGVYVSACVSIEGAPEWPDCSVSVLNVATGAVTKLAPNGGITTWLPGDRLLISGLDITAVEWDRGGTTPADIPPDTAASASIKGDLAFEWGDERTTVQLRVGGVDRAVNVGAKTVGQPYLGVWSPDGSVVAFVVHGPEPAGGQVIVFVPAR
jgi:hypothetical protein